MTNRRLLAPLSLALLPLALSACGSGGPTAQSLLKETQTALQNASSVHYVDSTALEGQTQTSTGSVSASAAQVILTVNATPQIDARLVGATAYLSTSSTAVLEKSLGIPSASASQWIGKWISLSSSDDPYNTLVSSLSITSEALALIPTSKNATLNPVMTFHGTKVYPIHQTTTSGQIATDLTLFVAVTTKLPVAATIYAKTSTQTERKQVVFTDWNKPVSVSAPTGATPFSSIPLG